MSEKLTPMKPLAEKYGLPAQTRLEVLGANHLAIVKMVKSRILVRDAEKIVEIAAQIRQKEPTMTLSLICTENICSKSIRLLEAHRIGVLIDEEE